MPLCRVPKKALGKDAFCRVPKNSTWQNTSLSSARKKALGKDAFCRVPKNKLGKMPVCRVSKKGTRQRRILPSAEKWHSVKYIFAECREKTLGKAIFAECFFLPSVFYLALGKDRLCRVPDKIHSAKPPALVKVPVSGSAYLLPPISLLPGFVLHKSSR